MNRRPDPRVFALAFLAPFIRVLGGPRRELPDWRARAYNVLFIRDDGIGDLILSIKVMRAIAEASPTFTFDVLASPQNAALARTLPFVSEVLVHRRGLMRAPATWRLLRRRGYDVIVDGRVMSAAVNTQTTLLLLASRSPWRVGLSGRGNDSVYTVPVAAAGAMHWIESLAALAGPFGVDPAARDWRPRVPLSSMARERAEKTWHHVGTGRPRVLVNISAHPDRRWPLDRFEPVIARLRRKLPRAAILVASVPAEQETAEHLASAGGATALPLSLEEVLAAVATADFVVTPDTAITHMATAFERPILVLMRKGAHRFAPYRTPAHVVVADDTRRLTDLSAKRVVAALDEAIAEFGPERGWM